MSCWLIKSEPEAYSFEQLVKDKKTAWTGIRNYTARNNLRAMKKGDLLLFYHSNTGKAVVGVARVLNEHYPDKTGEGDWSAVDIGPVKPFVEPVTLSAMREHPKLSKMTLFKLGRLSVVPVTAAEYAMVLALGKTTS
jgi:predicted RNA-binding protein with PUA-like domain